MKGNNMGYIVGRRIVLVLALMWVSAQAQQADASDFFSLVKEGTPTQVQAAIKAGADVNAKDNDDLTPLMRAAGHNRNPQVMAALIKAGADIHARNHEGQTALDIARKEDNSRALTELIKAGAR